MPEVRPEFATRQKSFPNFFWFVKPLSRRLGIEPHIGEPKRIVAKISIIIPCYNQGEYIEEALASVARQTIADYEIVVVDDGSTDNATRRLLEQLSMPKTRVIRTTNQGLAAARNNGIREAAGKYILPLDADDRIAPAYLEKAAAILETRPEVGIVYCQAELFGEQQGPWNMPPYSLEQMLLDNLIFCSAMFRKKDWERAGGYDEEMVYGWEDYDFWLSLIESGAEVCQIPEVLFYYRVAANSMVRSKSREQKVEMFARIFSKHHALFQAHIVVWIEKMLAAGEQQREIDKLRDRLEKLATYIDDRRLHIERLEAELDHVQNAREWKLAWRLARFFWKFMHWLPENNAGRNQPPNRPGGRRDA